MIPYPQMSSGGNRPGPHRVDTGMGRFPFVATAIMLIAVTTACSRSGAAPADTAPAFTARAGTVADSWRPTVTAPAWRSGLLPLQNLTVAPTEGLSGDLQQALQAGWFTTRVRLPAAQPPPGRVRFPDGAELSVPLVSAATAYQQVHLADPPAPEPAPATATPSPVGSGPDTSVGGPVSNPTALTVTGVRLGTTPLLTSRGRATVPAWLFTVAELPAPVARVAVAPTSVAAVPEVTVPAAAASAPFVGAQRLTGVDGNRLAFTIGIGACQTGPRGLVHETDDLVVIGGDPGTAEQGDCTALLVYEPVSVSLAAPLGGRPVIDAVTGRLLSLGDTAW